MSDMPKRIWAHPEQHPHYKDWDADGWCTTSKQTGGKWAEYIRRDAPELVALVEAAKGAQAILVFDENGSDPSEKLDRVFAATAAIDAALAAYEALK